MMGSATARPGALDPANARTFSESFGGADSAQSAYSLERQRMMDGPAWLMMDAKLSTWRIASMLMPLGSASFAAARPRHGHWMIPPSLWQSSDTSCNFYPIPSPGARRNS